jgi:hypothetical protein
MRFKHVCSLIGFSNSFFVLYLICCFGNNPLYMDFTPIKIMFCSVLSSIENRPSSENLKISEKSF